MSGVVLRCPNCGTTKASPGECDACHEAEVRFFCTNHKPGLWLESTQCPDCGARFGQPAVSSPPTPTPIPPQARPHSRRKQPPIEAVRTRSTVDITDPSGSPTRDLPSDAAEELRRKQALRNVIMARLPELLRTTRKRPVEDRDLVYRSSRLSPPSVGSFVARAMFLVFFIMIALFFFALLLGGSLLGGFGVVFL